MKIASIHNENRAPEFKVDRNFRAAPCALTVMGLWIACVFLCVPHINGAELPSAGPTAQSRQGMVVSVSRPASDVGIDAMKRGGNAVDAAVAVAFSLAVTWPEAGNIGGGGFMLIYLPDGTLPVVIDYRETAPAASTVDMFANGANSQYQLVGVPGTVRGLEMAHKRFGRLPWKELVQPAVLQSRDGILVDRALATSLNEGAKKFRDNAEFQTTYSQNGGNSAWREGDRIVQHRLSQTLERIALNGADAFYTGSVADDIVAEMKEGGGLITKADLAKYAAKERAAIHGTYRGFDIFAPPPPSSGGICLVEMLNFVERFDLRQQERWSPRTLHVMIEAMRRAYYDRARFLGDSEFVNVPSRLFSKDYAWRFQPAISPESVTSSAALGADILTTSESEHTTHFSIVDASGMAVANTYTLEQNFGSGIVVRGAGFLLNNEMGDFNPQPGVTTSGGMIGTDPNLVAPGKRMLSSMCPTIVSRGGRPVFVTGSPGGRTIINTVFEIIVDVVEYEQSLREAVDAPRFHHAWMPDIVRVEEELSTKHAATVNRLRDMGHVIEVQRLPQGDAHSIAIDVITGLRTGVADKRRGGWASGQ